MIFIDVQHMGRLRRIKDRGAWYDTNRDGAVDYLELEAYWTSILGVQLMSESYMRDLDCIMVTDGTYAARAKRCATYHKGDSIYLALHFNAGRGSYSSTFFDFRSAPTRGPRLASLIAGELGRNLPEVTASKAIPARPNDWTRNAYYTIKACPGKMIGICLEPAFLDAPNDQHRAIFTQEGIERVAHSVLDAIDTFKTTGS